MLYEVQHDSDEELLTASEVAALLKVSVRQAQRLGARGLIPVYDVGERGMRYKRRDVRAFVEGNRRKVTPSDAPETDPGTDAA